MLTPHGSATTAWLGQLKNILMFGELAHPTVFNHEYDRSMACDTLELLGSRVVVSMHRPVIICPERGLSYKFMAAEALWITSGDDTVEGIVPYNRKMLAYSDDGKYLYGAYGPRFVNQLPYAVETLKHDLYSRRVVINIWRESPRPTKDTPCTLSMQFIVRHQPEIETPYMDTIVTMRSSDIWLGLPYDIFSFTMMTFMLLCELNDDLASQGTTVLPGNLVIQMGSSHLYVGGGEGLQDNSSGAVKVLHGRGLDDGPMLPSRLLGKLMAWTEAREMLVNCRDHHRVGTLMFD